MKSKNLSLAKWHRIKSNYHRGKAVEGFIINKVPGGVLMYLGRGGMGFLRNYEIEKAKEYLGAEFPDRGYVKVIVKDYDDENQRLELALMPAEMVLQALQQIDPAYNGGRQIKVIGRVRSHIGGGVFLVLDNSIDGYLPISEIPVNEKQDGKRKSEELLYLNDIVEAVVTSIDYDKKRAQLSIKALWESEEEKLYATGPSNEEDEMESDIQDEAIIDYCQNYAGGARRRVLLLEDNADAGKVVHIFLQNRQRHEVSIAENANQALQLINENVYDCIIADIRLGEGEDGITVCYKIQQKQPNIKIVFVTGYLQNEDIGRMRGLGKSVLDCLVKPLELSVLGELVATLKPRKEDWWKNEELESAEFIQISGEHDENNRYAMFKDAFDECYSRAKELLPKFKMAVFKLEPLSRQFELCFSRGIDERLYRNVEYDLKYSPIADVIMSGSELFVKDISEDDGTFIKMRPLTYFNSFLGYPLKVMGKDEYGLFFFWNGSGGFTDIDYLNGLRIANTLAVNMERTQALKNITKERSQISVIEKFFPSMIHEIKNSIWTLQTSIDNLAFYIGKLKAGKSTSEWQFIDECTSIIKNEGCCVRNSLQSYMKMMAVSTSREVTSLKQILEWIINTMQFIAEDTGVKLELHLEEKHRMSKISYEALPMRYAIFNLILNAIEHVNNIGRRHPLVRISVLADTIGNYPIKIRVKDNGIGIHAQYFDKVFEPYFTTKPKGTGLGLYIAKMWIESLGGKLCIERSVMYSGTTFLIELPN